MTWPPNPSDSPVDTRLSTPSKDREQSPSGPDGGAAEIDRLLEHIEPGLRQPVTVVFRSLLKLLQRVPVFEILQQGRPPDEIGKALDNFRNEATLLVEFMLATATKTANRNELLSETLDGISFALSHDVKRLFDSELKAIDWKAGEQLSKGKVAHIQGLLTNCLQQSIITLAQAFDPNLDGGRLFDNYKARLMESLILCRDLTNILQKVRACENDLAGQLQFLMKQVDGFRNSTMQFLMYRDWQEFETMTESLAVSLHKSSEPGSPLHSFKCYLETLLGQVKLRAVLVDVFCDLSHDAQGGPEWGEAENQLAFELYVAELSSMIERGSSPDALEQPELV